MLGSTVPVLALLISVCGIHELDTNCSASVNAVFLSALSFLLGCLMSRKLVNRCHVRQGLLMGCFRVLKTNGGNTD